MKQQFIKLRKVLGLFAIPAMLTLGAQVANAQVKVGANPAIINGGSALEIESTTQGVLLPRIVLTSTIVWAPLVGTAVAGMQVYNTAAGITGTTAYPAAGAGVYYYDGAGWVSSKAGAASTVTGADNGLTLGYNSAGKVGLGGPLNKITNIGLNGFPLSIAGSYTSAFFLANGNIQSLDGYGKSITLDMSSNTANTDPLLLFKPYGSTFAARIGTSGSPLGFYTQGSDANSTTPAMYITNGGNVGINQTTPGNKLDINSGSAGASGLRFTNLKSTSPATTGGPIGVDVNGDVVRVGPSGPGGITAAYTGSVVIGAMSGLASSGNPGWTKAASYVTGGPFQFKWFANTTAGFVQAVWGAQSTENAVGTGYYYVVHNLNLTGNQTINVSYSDDAPYPVTLSTKPWLINYPIVFTITPNSFMVKVDQLAGSSTSTTIGKLNFTISTY